MQRIVWTFGLLAGTALSAHAHFIFLELPTDQPNTAFMRFSEEPLEDTSAGLQEKCAPMTVKTENGTSLSFTPGEVARLATVPEDTALLQGSLDYGIMDRDGEEYLLVYHAKAAINVENAAKTIGLPLEISTNIESGDLVVTVLADGKPVEGAELVVNLPTAKKQAESVTNAAGQASFPIQTGGWVGVRAKVQESRSGTHGDKAYQQVRSYSTLTFPYFAE